MSIYADSFIYDGVSLAEKGFVLCSFDSTGLENIKGVRITPKIVKSPLSNEWLSYGTQYDEHLEFPLAMCKCDRSYLSLDEISKMSRWLIRKNEFHQFQFECDLYRDTYFDATAISCEQMTLCENIIGLKFKFVTNAPFARSGEILFKHEMVSSDEYFTIENNSDDVGCIQPNIKIEMLEDGNLEIYNDIENRTTRINNCKIGELISISNIKQISTTYGEAPIYERFNWVYPRICNTYTNRINNFRIKTRCKIEMRYFESKLVGV